MTHQNTFNRSTRKVFAIDAHPIGTPTSEVEKAIDVAVREISGPISTITNTLAICFRIIPVSLESSAAAVHNFASGFLGVQKSTVSVKNCAWAFLVSGGITHSDCCLRCHAKRSGGHVRDTHNRSSGFGLPVAISEFAIEPFCKSQQINF